MTDRGAGPPRSRTGEKPEVPVECLPQGADISHVTGREAVDDIATLEHFTRFARPSGPSALSGPRG
ncbi:hypothetical protein [Streptomyces sp. NPDC019224]|uniref:hypothetical protein n=1 Tax=Streptomyces sp. NPDC019224 TaxID=3154484 RepID=UPI0033DDC042